MLFIIFYSILSPLLAEYDNNIKTSQEQVLFLKVLYIYVNEILWMIYSPLATA